MKLSVAEPKSKMRCQVAKALTLIQVATVKSVSPLVMPAGSLACWAEVAGRLRPPSRMPAAKPAPFMRSACWPRPLESVAMAPPVSSNLRWATRVPEPTATSLESGPVPSALVATTT